MHFFGHQRFSFPESKVKVAPDRSGIPPQDISVAATTSLSRDAQKEGQLCGGFVCAFAGVFQVPRIELSTGAPCLLNELMKDERVDGGGAGKRPCEW